MTEATDVTQLRKSKEICMKEFFMTMTTGNSCTVNLNLGPLQKHYTAFTKQLHKAQQPFGTVIPQ